MKDYKNVDEFMDDLENMAVAKSHGEAKSHEKHSQLFDDYFTLKQWYEKKFWESPKGLTWNVSRLCINEMRKILHALDMSELKTLADRHDELAKAVYTKRSVENLPRAEYDGNVADFISKFEARDIENE